MNNYKVIYSFQSESKKVDFGSIVVKDKDIPNAYDRVMYIFRTFFPEEFNYTVIEICKI